MGQTGEFLVASELTRRGFFATTFKGNIPHYDIVASTEKGKHVSVQVKTARGSRWQFARVDLFVEITFKNQAQIVGNILPSPVENLIFVFVKLGDNGSDNFYICSWSEFAEVISQHHSEYLKKHNGVRPKKWDSLHATITEKQISRFANQWDLFEKLLE